MTKTEYVVNDKISPLKVYATASGDVEYQWYSSTPRTRRGPHFEGHESRVYAFKRNRELYYYCIATTENRGTNTKNPKAHVVVYNYASYDFSWDVGEIPDLPNDMADKFNGNTSKDSIMIRRLQMKIFFR